MASRHYWIPLLLMTTAGTVYYFNCFYSESFFPPKEQKTRSIPTIVGSAYDRNRPKSCESISLLDTGGSYRQGWHRVDNNTEWYVYSAYFDNRQSISMVRIVAMSKGGSTAPLFCRWWWHHQTEIGSTPVRALKEELWIRRWDSAESDRYFHPYLLSCPVRSEPSAVSVVKEPCGQVTHRLPLGERSSTNVTGDFVVCLKPLDIEEDISGRLLEWLELQYLLGAERVHAYVYRVHRRTRQVLQYYVKLGKVVAVNYTLPGESKYSAALWQKRRHEMAVYNDCFYKHLRSHRFVVNLDLDEAMVPVTTDTWSELLADHPHPASASLSARNVYFFDPFGQVDNPSIPTGMHMLRHVVRSANFTPPGFAQKSFFSTDLALVVSNHFALKATRRDVRILIGLEPNLVRVHHYRKDCPPLMDIDCADNYMKFRERDTLLWKYKDRLIANVRNAMNEIGP